MKVKWTEYASASFIEEIYNMYPEANSCDFDKHYEGEVIGTTKSFWGTTYLTVSCTDGKIREVSIDKVQTNINDRQNKHSNRALD